MRIRYDPSWVKLAVLDRFHPDPRDGNGDQKILHLVENWIYKLNAASPPGLNDNNCFKSFL